MRLITVLLTLAALIAVAAPLRAAEEAPAPSNAEAREARVIIRSGDFLRGPTLEVTSKLVSVETPYSGAVKIDRRAVAGIAFGPGHDTEIVGTQGEADVLFLTTGDKISGTITRTDGDTLRIEAVYSGGKETSIALEQIDYLTLGKPGAENALELKPEPLRVIFANGDMVSGTLVSFKSDAFRLDTQYAGRLEFTTDDIQSLHNVEKSQQLFPGGLAEAFVRVIEGSGEIRRRSRDIFPILVQGFLSQGDVEGALYVFRRMGRYNIDPYTYSELANAFEAAKQPDAALLAYEQMFRHRRRQPEAFRMLFHAYARHGRYAKAAEIYEDLLKQPTEVLASSSITEPDVRMALAEVYTKLEEYERAIGHLRKVLDDPQTEPSKRQEARTILVNCFKKTGQLDELVAAYTAEMETLDEQLGKDYLALVEQYIARDRLAKARMQVERLQHLGLDEYAAQAQALLDAARGTRPEDEPEPDENDNEE